MRASSSAQRRSTPAAADAVDPDAMIRRRPSRMAACWVLRIVPPEWRTRRQTGCDRIARIRVSEACRVEAPSRATRRRQSRVAGDQYLTAAKRRRQPCHAICANSGDDNDIVVARNGDAYEDQS